MEFTAQLYGQSVPLSDQMLESGGSTREFVENMIHFVVSRIQEVCCYVMTIA